MAAILSRPQCVNWQGYVGVAMYNSVQYYMIYYMQHQSEHKSGLKFTNNTTYLALIGKIQGGYCEN